MAHRITDHRRHRLSLADVRALLRLYSHVYRSGPDAATRKRRLLEGVRELTQADHASATVAQFGAAPVRPGGHRGRGARSRHQRAGDATAVRTHKVVSVIRAPGGIPMPNSLNGDCAWSAYDRLDPGANTPRSAGGRSAGFCTAVPASAGHEGHRVHAFLPLVEGRLVACLTVGRGPGSRWFSTRDRSLLCALHAEAAWLYQADSLHLSPDAHDLSPRQLETLRHLLSGKGEKQVARDLRVSYNTLHHYVKSLYRHFDVTSRVELLARWSAG